MTTVIADTGPINYLIVIGEIDLLPTMFGQVLIPDAVAGELGHPGAPVAVREWIGNPSLWLSITPTPPLPATFHSALGRGERSVIALAQFLSANSLLLLDDRGAIAAASSTGLQSLGTLGVLVRAANRGLVDLPAAFDRLKATNFRVRPSLLAALAAQHNRP